MSKEPAKLRIQMVRPADFRFVYATGAYGGVGPAGDIQFVLVADRSAMPEAEEVFSDENGRVLETRQFRTGTEQVVREMVVGVQMSADAAESLGKWLLSKVEERRRGGGRGLISH